MKNQYFGDINDFMKYGLLRCVIEASELPIGMGWFLTENDSRSDGELRRHLSEARRWRRYDPALFDALSRVDGDRSLRTVDFADEWQLLPAAKYFSAIVPDEKCARERYFAEMLAHLQSCPVIFLDPDNGLEVPSRPLGRKGSSKYVYWSEVESAFSAGHSLVIYQHFGRRERDGFIKEKVRQARERLGACFVEAYRTSNVVFFLAARPEHFEAVRNVRGLVARRWGDHISVEEPSEAE